MDEDDELFFDDDEVDDIFSGLDSDEQTDTGDILKEYIEPFFKPARKMVFGSNLAEISIPQKRKFRGVLYHKFRIHYDKVKSYEVIPVKAAADRASYPLDKPQIGLKELGEIFLFGFNNDETDWYAFDAFIPKEEVRDVAKILLEKVKRPQLKGITHYGNLAAIKYVMDQCEIVYEYKIELTDWVKGSQFMRPARGKYEKYVPKKDESTPPTVSIFKEGIAQIFEARDPPILQQMSTFWPWNLISKVTEKDNKLKIEWYDKTYAYEQLISDSAVREKIIKICIDCLESSKNKKYQYAHFIRSNSFPSRYETSWYNLEPFGCDASRSGLPPVN